MIPTSCSSFNLLVPLFLYSCVYLMFLHECHNKVLTSEIPMWFRPSKYYPNAKSQVHLHEMLKHVKILAWIDRYIGIVEFAGIIVWLLHQAFWLDSSLIREKASRTQSTQVEQPF